MNPFWPFLIMLLFSSTVEIDEVQKNWTIIYYAVGSNSSEIDLLNDVEEMKLGISSDAFNVVLLIDRTTGHSEDSTALDGNFIDTRLYQIEEKGYSRLDGKEFFPAINTSSSTDINMGDAENLKKLIQYSKKYYPANHYMLVLRSHGNGMGMCPDPESGVADRLYPAELRNVLEPEESVDILGLDVCSMAGLENLYEWRPDENAFSAEYVIASAPLSGAWAYDRIFERLTNDGAINDAVELDNSYFTGEAETFVNPSNMNPEAFANLIFEEIYDSQRWGSWGLFDNTKIKQLKSLIDKVSQSLALEDKDILLETIRNSLGYYHNTSGDLEVAQLTFPYVDAFHFWQQISAQEGFSTESRSAAEKVCQAIDELVIHSYYGEGFLPTTQNFVEGKGGVYQIIPQGDKIFAQTNRSFWSHMNWFHPDDKSSDQNSYGQYDWCKDGAIRGNQKVDNFYELLDYLFDSSNDQDGGINGYQW